MVKGETIVISGGGGFIASHLIKRLKKHNKVIAFDLNIGPGVLHGDVLKKDVSDFVKKGAIVIHMASVAGVDNVMSDPIKCDSVITAGTMNMVEAAINNGAKRFINLSTSEVLRNTAFNMNYVQINNGLGVKEARWSYATAKSHMEYLVLRTCYSFGLPAVNIRPFNVFGPGQKTGGAILKFINQALRNETIEIRNHGEQIRSWTYIDDFIDGLLLAIEKPECNYYTIHIGNPANTLSIQILAMMIRDMCRSMSKIEHIDWKEADVQCRIPGIEETRKLLGFEPRVTLKEGLKKTIEYYRSQL